ncbi:putative oxalocrotonate tautomerase [Paraphoma chrysanthemicola]|nr:putative oxalocrotonate tautomerase [Paraphoma chrysanthemicola]
MPVVRIHYPTTSTFTTHKERKALADDITDMYISYGLPAFYAVTLYYPLPDDHIFVGGRDDDNTEPPLVRIMFDHIARTIESLEQGMQFFAGVDKILKKHILDKGYDYEYHLIESPREYCKMNGMYLPPNDSEAEAVWVKENRPSHYKGMERPTISFPPMQMRAEYKELVSQA